MSTSAISSIPSTGLSANQARLSVAAHNIANASTEGFKRQEVHQEARPDGGVRASVRQTEQVETNISQDVVEQKVALYNAQANVQVIRTGNGMLGSLLDISA